MKNRFKQIAVMGLVALLIGSISIPAMATSIQDAKDKKSSLEKAKKKIEQTIKDLEKEKGDITAYISKLDKELDTINNKIDKLEKDISLVKTDLKKTKAELKEAKETEENQYITMKKRIKYMYENGSSDYIEVLLSSNDMSDLLNRTEYITKISEYDGEMLDRYQETKKKVEKKEAELKSSLEALNNLNEEVELEKDAVTKLINEKNKELSSYEAKIDESSEKADEFAEKIKIQEDVIDEMIEAQLRAAEEAARKAEEERKKNEAANGGSAGSGNVSSSGFMWPSDSSTRITSTFGYRKSPTAGASSYHQGIDIGAAAGSNVLASADGTVTVATYQWAAGNYIMISHPNGISTVYMHNSKLLVSVGQTVKKGDVIAKVGSTGVSTGPHIHFGVRVNGAYVNPLNYVSP
ncbi:septal ring factor EnvC (AmiA/AmiB activator) [Mobilisporobacter senegalensis]|uniref:Septal ring factor EnvC (AmiA/AmiB activator) n=1 Tax=Mobilisporobacter senegalensis TaxID=1329262 RepID=A0A3N1Y284_9FIRM|nr:DUF3450 family protein [Mobilisporobacter senegalensis]ROR31642.1 septal ring factor EnvC (AmiA/AmiB activator) [Mobilisporobacter senegalensis]